MHADPVSDQVTYEDAPGPHWGPKLQLIMERAPRVCAICKFRKKGCDKALPRCEYCTQRGLVCIYEDPAPPDYRRGLVGSNAPWSTSPSHPSSPFQNSNLSYPPMTVEDTLHHEVSKVFRITERAFWEVCEQYFGSFHRWLPVVSYDLLVKNTTQCIDKCPPADFSLLVLAIYLVTLDPSDDNRTQIIPPQTLYLELRMSFTRVQTVTSASTRLIQTGILLAAYEYACGRPHAAYISIGTCVRMASILGIDQYSRPNQRLNGDIATDVESLEVRNLYWAMIMLERLILYECPLDHLKPALVFPSSDTELPSDLISPNCVNSPSSQDVGQAATVGDLHANNVTSFGRQIQAISFLVQVLQVTDDSKTTSISELIKLDEELRGFLTILMGQCPGRHQCGANGIMIRSLVRLHQYILKRPCTPGHPEAKVQEQSHATLDTLARMMIEVAYDHVERFVPSKIDSLPLSCSYNMRSMMELIEDRWGQISSKQPPKGLEAFAALHKAVCKRWRCSLEH